MGVFRRTKIKIPKDTDICKSCGELRVHDSHDKVFGGERYHEFDAPLPPSKGIFVTGVKHEEAGEVVALYCPMCKVTNFMLSPWATKDDSPFWMYWKLSMPCHTHLVFADESVTQMPPDEIMVGTFKNTVMS